MKRQDAERQLQNLGRPGSFMVRESESQKGMFSLSLRDHESIKHYRIRSLDDKSGYFVSKQFIFGNLSDLVEFYSKESNGLAFRLLEVRDVFESKSFWQPTALLYMLLLLVIFYLTGSPKGITLIESLKRYTKFWAAELTRDKSASWGGRHYRLKI